MKKILLLVLMIGFICWGLSDAKGASAPQKILVSIYKINTVNADESVSNIKEFLIKSMNKSKYTRHVHNIHEADLIVMGEINKNRYAGYRVTLYLEDNTYELYTAKVNLSSGSKDFKEIAYKMIRSIKEAAAKIYKKNIYLERYTDKIKNIVDHPRRGFIYVKGGKFVIGSDGKYGDEQAPQTQPATTEEGEFEGEWEGEGEDDWGDDDFGMRKITKTNKKVPGEDWEGEDDFEGEWEGEDDFEGEWEGDVEGETTKPAEKKKNYGFIEPDEDEKNGNEVTVDDLYVDKFEVTNYQYKKFIEANPQWKKGNVPEHFADSNYLFDWNGDQFPKGKAAYPVRYTSWFAAKAYAEWLGRRLPTEAEWEYVASFKKGKYDPNKILHLRWSLGQKFQRQYYSFDERKIGPVGRYPKNGAGLYDTSGSVAEWCSTIYEAYPYKADDGREDTIFTEEDIRKLKEKVKWYKPGRRVVRGGAYTHFDSRFLRCSNRMAAYSNKCRCDIGFRTVKTVPDEEKIYEKKPEKKEEPQPTDEEGEFEGEDDFGDDDFDDDF